ncbi:hypothetical protein WM46_04550 [Citrobacter freundii complex sp. CFNIH2]|uniref:hypothetical protein n=1 Tax=Citrobacter freundii complex sp. CFNIH2 TaxID=2066049 RepID=UPI000C86B06A|nr:hypothetical protein [Citrobacter freundii complex sp. CFNIH2]AUO64082.1 hypothetical protein WM46_04550 [Citrobacter freundii complex sp. CFNIH2]
MSNIDKQALLSTDKHANQHRLSRLTMEVHSDELRIIASAVESYTDELIAALEAAEKLATQQENIAVALFDEVTTSLRNANDNVSELRECLAAAEKRITELLSENAGLKNSVENAAGCINAAYAEGLIDVLSESNDERLVDLVKRRLLFSYLPVETPATNEKLIAMGDWVLRDQLEDGTRAIKTLNRRMAELEIARDKCFLSGLKTGWLYGIADDTEGYNHEISDAQAVIDRAAGIGKGE